MMKKANILYIEHPTLGENTLESNKKFIKSIFEPLHYDVEITMYLKKDILRDVIGEIVTSKSVDVIFCDLTFGDRKDGMGYNLLGLDTVTFLKKMYPEIIICGISGAGISYRDTTSRDRIPTFDLFVDKARFGDPVYKGYVSEEMRRIFCSNTEIELVTDNLPDGKLKNFANEPSFKRVLKKITFTNYNEDDGIHVKKIVLYPTKGGYSSSYVFKMVCFTKNGEQVIRSVIKCSEKANALQEINNYMTYVKWYLPYTWRPELLSYAFVKLLETDYGVICYSFAYNDDVLFSSLADKISTGEYETVEKVIDNIFSNSHKQWYGQSNRQTQPKNINDYYSDVYFLRDEQIKPYNAVERLVHLLGGHTQYDKYVINGMKFPSAYKLFVNIVANTYEECICHGDLHANNILLSGGTNDKNNEIIFIDFQKTGKGHVFQDFVIFELSLRLYHTPTEDVSFDTLLKNEIAISQDDFSLVDENSILSCVKKVRTIAKESFKEENFDTYLLSMAMRAFKLFRDIEAAPDNWKAKVILAVLLANLLELDNKKEKGISTI